jgi:tetratricopeptide (TPR) repeat protein
VDKARGLSEEALGLARRASDRVLEASILANLGRQRGEFYGYDYLRRDMSGEDLARRAAAQPLFEQAVALATEAGYAKVRIRALGNLAMISYGTGDLSASRQQAENALALARDVSDKMEMGEILVLVGRIAADQGDRDHAREVIAEAVELGADGFRNGRGRFGLVGCALALAHLSATVGRLKEAVLLDTAVATWVTLKLSEPAPHISALMDQRLIARRTLGQAEVDRAVAKLVRGEISTVDLVRFVAGTAGGRRRVVPRGTA